jgi:CRISPR-associated endonuclease/helicase Cas3
MSQDSYIAHSTKKINSSPQSYQSHVGNVINISKRHLKRAKKFVKKESIYKIIEKSVIISAVYHDLGKLLEQCQKVLKGESNDKMVNHVSAGVIYLLKEYRRTNKLEYLIAAYVVHAHHIGFLNFNKTIERKYRGGFSFSIDYIPKDGFKDRRSCEEFGLDNITVDSYSERNLEEIINIHNSLIPYEEMEEVNQKDAIEVLTKTSLLRFCLSILCDSDHEDTSLYYKEPYPHKRDNLFPLERANLLKNYINLKSDNKTLRNSMRKEFFDLSQKNQNDSFALMDGTVGIGKTNSSTIYALTSCHEENLDTLFIVLPYISLIEQTRDSLSKVISFSEKDAKYNICAVHSICKSDNLFHSKFYKNLNSPIVITTSINFLDVLTSNKLSVLKNLHKIVGSAVIMDEYHSAANYEFWPVILALFNEISYYFKIKVCFCSGSPTEYWNLNYNMDKFRDEDRIKVRNIVPESFHKEMIKLEKNRVAHNYILDKEMSFEEILERILALEGSVFIVFTTKKRAHRFFSFLKNKKDLISKKVYLRYSMLSPLDRTKQLDKVKNDLNNNIDIILVATEGSDIGLDISFRHGFKDISSSNSILQISGRINRNCEFTDSTLTVFLMKSDPDGIGELKGNPSLKMGINAFSDFAKGIKMITPEYCTTIAQEELNRMKKEEVKKMNDLYKAFCDKEFERLDDEFNIISSSTIKVIVDKNILDNKKIKWNEVQENTVTIYNDSKTMEKISGCLIPIKIPKMNDDQTKGEEESTDIFIWGGLYDKENEGLMLDPIFSGILVPMIV